MSQSFHDVFKRALQKKGYRSLTAFYQSHPFSFSYEYLRQIYTEKKLPAADKVQELATAVGMSEHRLQKLADELRLERTIRKYYQYPAATRSGRLTEKVKRYGRGSKVDTKINEIIEQLGDEEKEQLLLYLKLLRKQWRKKEK